MPGSTTLNPLPTAIALNHGDAERLLALLTELSHVTANTPDRLTDAQAAALAGTPDQPRSTLTAWLTHMTTTLGTQLHQGLGHA